MKIDTDGTHLERMFRRLPILKGLSSHSAKRLLSDFYVVRASKDEVIFHHYDQSTDLYLIINGAVKACLVNPEGHELILATFHTGDFFGEMSLMDGKPRSATMVSVGDTVLGVLKRERFLNAIKDDPMIAIDLLSAIVSRMRMSNEMIEALAFLDVSQRLVKTLVQNSKVDGERTKDGHIIIKKLTHRELAAHTGASREAVSKAMKVLAFKNILIEKDGYFLLSPEAEHLIAPEQE